MQPSTISTQFTKPVMQIVPDDFTFSGQKVPRVQVISHEEKRYLETYKVLKHMDGRQVRHRMLEAINNPYRWFAVKLSENVGMMSDATKRAMLWQAESIALSSDRPGAVLLNRNDRLFSHFMSCPEILTHYLQDKELANKLSLRKVERLSDSELNTIGVGYYQYRDEIGEFITQNRTSLATYKKSFIRNMAAYRVRDVRDRELFSGRSLMVLYAYSARSGFLSCGEAVGMYLETKLRQGNPSPFIPIAGHFDFVDFEYTSANLLCPGHSFNSTDHVMIFLFNQDDYQRACREELFKTYEYKYGYKINITHPANSIVSVGSQTEGDSRSDPAVSRQTKDGLEAEKSPPESKKPCLMTETENTAFTGAEAPPVLHRTTAFMADPLLQNWQELMPENWTGYLKKVAWECNLTSFQGYKIEFNQVF